MKLIILDRDGVINEDSENYIKHVDEWKPIPNSLKAIAKLNQAGYKIVIATNQSGVGRGLFTFQDLEQIHQVLLKKVEEAGGHIEAIFYCPHTPSDRCSCRKPETGLFELIANYFQISLEGVPAIGDSKRDIEAAFKMGCSPILVRTGKGEQLTHEDFGKVPVYKDLDEAVSAVIKKQN